MTHSFKANSNYSNSFLIIQIQYRYVRIQNEFKYLSSPYKTKFNFLFYDLQKKSKQSSHGVATHNRGGWKYR